MKKLIILVILVLVLLGVQTVDGWVDHYTSDTSADYVGEVSHFEWSTGGNGYLVHDAEDPWNNGGNQVYYDEVRSYGTYIWDDVSINTVGALFIFGAQATDRTGTYAPLNGYGIYAYFSNIFRLDKSVAGVYTNLDTYDTYTQGTHNVTVVWTSGNIDVYLDDVLRLSAADNTFSDGYQGYGTLFNNQFGEKVDRMIYIEEAAPTPTPTPTPTPAPISVCTNKNLNITIEKGETWIKWNWSYTENISQFIIDYQDIYLNGTVYRSHYPHNYLNLPDIGSNSYQVLEVWGNNDTYCNCTQHLYSAVRSDPAYVWWYLIIGLVLLTVGYFVPLFGFLAIILFLLGFYMSYQEYNQSYIILTYGLAVVIAMFITAFRISGGMKR